MADGIRGNHFTDYPVEVQIGIRLHRFIDSYTDSHPIFRQSTKRLHTTYSHLSGVIVDMFYDHFLAKNWSQHHHEPLEDFVNQFYGELEEHYAVLNDKTKHLLPYMKRDNWLSNYQYIPGLEKILAQMDHRMSFDSKMSQSIKELVQHYQEFETEFSIFMEDIKKAAGQELEKLLLDSAR